MGRIRAAAIKKYCVTKYQKQALEYLRPPENLTVSQWAEKYRVLDTKTSAVPGPWRNEKTPYLCGIMDEFNNYETEEIIFVKPSQVGGTEAMQNMLGYVIAQDPAPAMVVYPTDMLAKSVSENRIEPMILSCPQLSQRYNKQKSEKLELQFDGMYLSLEGSNSPSKLASKAIKYLFLDEVDKYPGASGREADPISLARERTKTFHNRKIFMTSTPTLKTGHIWKAKESADIEKHYFVPCPHCGSFIELKWAQVQFPGDESMSYADRAECAVYTCNECGGYINDADKVKMLLNGRWQTVKQNTRFASKVVYWINTLYSPFVRFSDAAREFLFSKDDPERLQNFINSWLAEPWEDTKLKTSAELVNERQTQLKEFVVPDWAKILTAGVDVQENCLYWSIRAWGDNLTSQNVAHGQAFGFGDIEDIMNLEYRYESGDKVMVQLALIDSGNNADEVYDFCASAAEWALPCKGSSNPMLSHYKISRVNKATSRAYGMNLIIVDTGKYKDMIAGRMRRPNGRGSWMVYNGCDREYAEQVTSEHKVLVKSSASKRREEWVLKSSHADNHYLDCEVYAACAADILGVRTLHLQTAQKAEETPRKQDEENDKSWIRNEEDWL